MHKNKDLQLIEKGYTWLGSGLSIQVLPGHNSRICTGRFSRTKLRKLWPRRLVASQRQLVPIPHLVPRLRSPRIEKIWVFTRRFLASRHWRLDGFFVGFFTTPWMHQHAAGFVAFNAAYIVFLEGHRDSGWSFHAKCILSGLI